MSGRAHVLTSRREDPGTGQQIARCSCGEAFASMTVRGLNRRHDAHVREAIRQDRTAAARGEQLVGPWF